MPRKKLIVSGRLGEFTNASVHNTDYVIHWISQRFKKWEESGAPLATKNLPDNVSATHAKAILEAEKKAWGKIVGKWDALWVEQHLDRDGFKELYQDLVLDLRAWLEERLSDKERTRMLNALRQKRYQAKHSMEIRSRAITIRVNRGAYEAATHGLPERQKGIVITRLLERFANDASLRDEVLGESESPLIQ